MIVAPWPMAQSTSAQPNAALVLAIAACAFARLKKRESPM